MPELARWDDTIAGDDLSHRGASLIDIKTTVTSLTQSGVTITFLKENLTFYGNDDPASNLRLGKLSSLAAWGRAVFKSRQMEGVKIARGKGIYKERCG